MGAMTAGATSVTTPERFDATFATLADSARGAILVRRAAGEASVP